MMLFDYLHIALILLLCNTFTSRIHVKGKIFLLYKFHINAL